jgi:hypothetical protein
MNFHDSSSKFILEYFSYLLVQYFLSMSNVHKIFDENQRRLQVKNNSCSAYAPALHLQQ